MTNYSNTTALDGYDDPAFGRAAPASETKEQSATNVLMKAVVATGYGSTDVLTLTELDRPVPKENEVLIKIHATNVSAADSMMRRGDPAYARLFLGLRKPKRPVPGTGLAGVVEAVGDTVKRFQLGDAVYGGTGVGFGAHAEYVCVPEDGVITLKPETMTFEDAAVMCDGPVTSLNFLKRMAKVTPGQKVLINGASGSLGTAAVQLARAFGAEVTGVCSTANVELVKSLGADKVIDYTEDDFTHNGETYDVIYDTIGTSTFRRCVKSLTPRGKYMSPVLAMRLLFHMITTALLGRKKAMFDATGLRPATEQRVFLAELETLMAEGKLRIVTERSYRLEHIAEAHAHVDTGHKKGNIVVCVVDGN